MCFQFMKVHERYKHVIQPSWRVNCSFFLELYFVVSVFSTCQNSFPIYITINMNEQCTLLTKPSSYQCWASYFLNVLHYLLLVSIIESNELLYNSKHIVRRTISRHYKWKRVILLATNLDCIAYKTFLPPFKTYCSPFIFCSAMSLWDGTLHPPSPATHPYAQQHKKNPPGRKYLLKEVMSMDQVSDALTGQYSQHRLNLWKYILYIWFLLYISCLILLISGPMQTKGI